MKVYRLFPELRGMGDAHGRALAHRVRGNYHPAENLLPLAIGLVAALAWVGFYVQLWILTGVQPATRSNRDLWFHFAAAAGGALLFYLLFHWLASSVRLYIGLRRELKRTRCPKCHQSLVGLRIDQRGDVPNPNNVFVRCAECGKVHRLLDLGLAARELLPFDRAADDASIGTLRGGQSAR